MPLNQTQRPKFYEEQYLGAADLTAAVDYGRIQSARHALGAHTWGIAAGLQLKEKEAPTGGGQVEMFIQPGYAWDGFGRPIVVLASYKIPAELFKSIPFAAGSPAGQLIKVWLCYNESATQRARPGFEVCDRADQFSRVQETFRVEIGERPNHDDRHNPISVAGYLVDAQETLHKLDPTDPQLYDESVPYQNFPDTGAPARWLIPLGAVLWQPNPDPNQPGAFAKRSEDDLKFSRNLRRYIGVVVEAIEAADGRIRMKSRAKDYSTVVSDDLVWVEGDLRVEGDVRLFNHKLDFRDSSGLDHNGIPLSIQRVDRSGASSSLQVMIGQSEKGDNTFAVGPLVGSDKFAAKLTVRDDGNVGIGTSNPTQMLTFSTPEGNRLEIGRTSTTLPWSPTTPARPGAFVINQQSQGSSEPGADFALMRDRKKRLTLLDIDTNLSSQGGGSLRFFVNYDEPSGSQEALTITGAGNVGIGTTNPTLKLDIQGDLGRDNGPATLHLWDSRIGDIGGGILFLRSGVGIVTFDGNDKVGLGLNAPTCKLHVTDSLNANADNVNAHVAVIENSHGGPDADVLALKVGRSSPTASNNFITFFGGNNVVGQIEGNGPNAVTFKSGGADFAECLPRLDPDEVIEEGDIVGVFAGKISKRTKGAHHVTVISRQPIMVGNLPPMGDEHLVNKVVVVGQVRGKVRGAVQAGDFIIPSGDDDGVGMAITPDQFTAKGCTQVVGRAWESSDEMAIKTINTAVGFVASAVGEALVSMLRDQQEEIAALRTELRKLAVTRAA